MCQKLDHGVGRRPAADDDAVAILDETHRGLRDGTLLRYEQVAAEREGYAYEMSLMARPHGLCASANAPNLASL